jgi:hypothetical protein
VARIHVPLDVEAVGPLDRTVRLASDSKHTDVTLIHVEYKYSV